MGIIGSDRRILVVGLGKTGLSCVRFLCAQGHDVAVADSRLQPPGLDELSAGWPQVVAHLGGFDGDLFASFSELVVSPGISIAEPAIQQAAAAGARIVGDIDLFSREAKAPVVAITGSNGKTTVTTLLGEMAVAAGLKIAVGGNIGTPALDLLDDAAELYVLELSSFQLETTEKLGAQVATLLNISDDHMDRYPGKTAYYHAKQRVFHGCRQAVVNLDDALSAPMDPTDLADLCFGFNRVNPDNFSTVEDEHGTWITFGLGKLLLTSSLKVIGRHNISNVMAALALGKAVGLPMDIMVRVAQAFHGLPHRCEFVRALDGVEFINDSKGTNVGATVAAIESLVPDNGKLVLIAGGAGKGADFQSLQQPVLAHCRGVVLFGQDAEQMTAALPEAVPVVRAESLQNAVVQARAVAQPGDRVLLSPACASLDMFRDYLDRGDQFRTLVEGL